MGDESDARASALRRVRAIAVNTRLLRRAARKTQQELGSAIGRSQQTIKEIEASRRKRINAGLVNRLAEALAVEPWQIDPTRLAERVSAAELTPEQQLAIDTILSLPPEDVPIILEALAKLRKRSGK